MPSGNTILGIVNKNNVLGDGGLPQLSHTLARPRARLFPIPTAGGVPPAPPLLYLKNILKFYFVIMSKRSYQLTLNEVERFESLKENLLKYKNLNYILAGKEKAPTTGHEHIHLYVQLTKPTVLNIKKLEGAHIEKCLGSPEQNIKYIRKPDTEIIFEYGEPHLKKNTTSFPTIKQVKEMSREERDELPIQYFKQVKEINLKEDNDIDIDEYFKEDIKVYYLWGESGIGKTKRAIEIIRELGYKKFNEIKYTNGFWIGTGSAEVALYDDFRDSHMKASEFINFIDYNIHNLNTKFGYIKNKYKIIIITSIQSPDEIYRNLESKEQWIRRLNIININ